MKPLFLTACIAAILLACTDDKPITLQTNKKLAFKFTGVDIKSGSLPGRTNNFDPIYCFIEVKKGNEYYATGVFKSLPPSLQISLPDNTNFTVNIKAVRKGWSYGIRRFVENNRTTINWAEAQDSLNYQHPMHNGADAGLCWVYLKPDSSETNFQAYPQTDTYAARLEFNSGTTVDTTVVELKRQIWGIESRIHHFEKGKVSVVLAEGLYSNPPDGTSRQVINYPDSSKLDIFSLGFLHQGDNMVHMRVIYNDGTEDHVAYDGYISVARLEKKVLDIDLGRFNAMGGRIIGFDLLEETLTAGEIITIK